MGIVEKRFKQFFKYVSSIDISKKKTYDKEWGIFARFVKK